MKIIHTKNAGKSEEELIIETISKHMNGVFKKFLGQTDQKDIDRINNLTKDVLKKLANLPIESCPCLICGSICPKGDCQLGME